MKKIINIVYIILSLFLGGMMIYGGSQKFARPIPPPTRMIEQVVKEGPDKLKDNQKVLKIRNYIFGLKQTNYFWQVLGVCELLFGLLLVIQGTGFIGAVLLLPITLHILLFHVFLEPDDTGELIQTGTLFLINIILVAKEFLRWKHLVWIKFY